MDGIRYWIETEGAGHWFFIAFPIVLCCLLIWFKGRRVRFLIPSLLISLVILNPVFYKVWDDLGLYAYWRILWVVPVIPVVAGLIPSVTERVGNTWLKVIIATVGVGLIVFGGTFLYGGPGGSFVEAANASKIPNDVVKIADRLLELDDHPRVIADSSVSTYIRQYTGEIDTLFGRDIYGYIKSPSQHTMAVSRAISEYDWDIVSETMLVEGFEYYVGKEANENYFELTDTIGEYSIYRAVGLPTCIKKRNDLGQVVSITSIDINGIPTNGALGYATVCYDYDSYGNITKEFYLDDTGKMCEQPGGYSQINQLWDSDSNLLWREYLDENGRLVERNDGYAKVIMHQENNIWNAHFYNLNNEEIDTKGLNLIRDLKSGADGWSEWMKPVLNTNNSTFYIGTLNLGEKNEGDNVTCQIEIEFNNVSVTEGQKFRFWTQGGADDKWDIGNPWNYLVSFDTPPEDGIYYYNLTTVLSEKMAQASTFDIGFRCDNWASGSFRVHNVKIEKGDVPTEWTPGL